MCLPAHTGSGQERGTRDWQRIWQNNVAYAILNHLGVTLAESARELKPQIPDNSHLYVASLPGQLIQAKYVVSHGDTQLHNDLTKA